MDSVAKLSQGQQRAVSKIDNILNSFKDSDITGTLKDMADDPVPKPGDGYWDHLKEMNDMLRGLRNHAETLNGVSDPVAQAARQRALDSTTYRISFKWCRNMKFRDLEKGTPIGWLSEDKPSSLTEWYLSVRDIHLSRLGVGDVCRAIRQDLFVREILPVAIALLNDDVLAGERYDGELVAALSGLSQKYWQENAIAAYQATCALAKVEKISNDTDLLRDVSTLAKVLGDASKL